MFTALREAAFRRVDESGVILCCRIMRSVPKLTASIVCRSGECAMLEHRRDRLDRALRWTSPAACRQAIHRSVRSTVPMKPSVALEQNREAVRAAVSRRRAANPRVFGSALRGEDREDSDHRYSRGRASRGDAVRSWRLADGLGRNFGRARRSSDAGDLPRQHPSESRRGGRADMTNGDVALGP